MSRPIVLISDVHVCDIVSDRAFLVCSSTETVQF